MHWMPPEDRNVISLPFPHVTNPNNTHTIRFFFSLCGWNNWYAPQGKDLGNAWRIGPDDTNWDGVLANIDINANLSDYAGPSKDGTILVFCCRGRERCTTNHRITNRFQFSKRAVMASPLSFRKHSKHE